MPAESWLAESSKRAVKRKPWDAPPAMLYILNEPRHGPVRGTRRPEKPSCAILPRILQNLKHL